MQAHHHTLWASSRCGRLLWLRTAHRSGTRLSLPRFAAAPSRDDCASATQVHLSRDPTLLGSLALEPYLPNSSLTVSLYALPECDLQTHSGVQWLSRQELFQRVLDEGAVVDSIDSVLSRGWGLPPGQLQSWLDGLSPSARETNHAAFAVAPGCLSFPVKSATLPPFNSTNMLVFLRDPEQHGGTDSSAVTEVGGCDHDADVLLVDPSPDEAGEPLFWSALAHADVAAALARGRLCVFITHHHHDHVAGLPLLDAAAQRAGVRVRVFASTRTHAQLHLGPRLHAVHVNGGERISVARGAHRLAVVAAPGHTDSHLCLHSHRGLLAAGDHTVGHGSAVLDAACGCMSAYLDTSRRLLHLHPLTTLVPAHGPSTTDPHALLTAYIAHRQAREDAILRACRQLLAERHGAATPDLLRTLTEQVYTDTPAAMLPLAVSNVRLHLQKLLKDRQLPDSVAAMLGQSRV
mmetsp:Transcript_30740/g.77121  ORF Transcript_30740/g.77121 Transcript_30740/m.77121 type:complete len:462 (-) Transcript_30740:68-1453(-)